MNITISQDVFERFHPDLKIAFILIKNCDNQSKLKESLHLLHEQQKLIRLLFNKDTVKTHHLISPWVAAQTEFGPLAKHYHTSVERLIKATLAGKKIDASDTITNLVRFISLKHILPLEADDLSKIKGNLTFAVAAKKTKIMPTGALYYHDNKDLLGAKLDYWKNKRTALSPNSTSALIHIEALPPINSEKLKSIAKELADLLASFCTTKPRIFLLDQKKKTISW
ncbi:hypothetical protein HYX14_03500 [Candidatus Woesearchaeota archaeon]|nr:hypothetical protein [Candidatus Woesearchaeota archaeon]